MDDDGVQKPLQNPWLLNLLTMDFPDPIQEEEKEKQEESVTAIAGEFFGTTTIHGVGRVFKKSNVFRRVVWFLVFLVFVVWSVYQIGLVINDYNRFSKNINRKVVVETNVVFPAVTVCNLSPLPRSPALADHPLWAPFMDVEDCYSGKDSLPRCESMGDERLKREVKTTEGNGINIIQKQEETGNKQDSSELSPRHPATGLDNRVQTTSSPSTLPRLKRSIGAVQPQECLPGMFRCNDGTCIHSRLVCDGDGHCPDKEDEQTCCGCPEYHVGCNDRCYPDYERCFSCGESGCDDVTPPCKEGYFQCSDGRCINNHFLCDGHQDCSWYGEDEKNCTTCKEGFLCHTGECLPHYLRCDVSKNCPGGEDESQCDRCAGGVLCPSGDCIEMKYRCKVIETCGDMTWCVTCGEGYECRTGECIPSYQRCDAVKDCPEGDDEGGCDSCKDGFLCNTGECVPFYLTCNAEADCPEGEDELACETCQGYLCKTGECLPSDVRCNGTKRCPGGEDEEECDTCTEGFLCSSGKCLHSRQRCDTSKDCPDDGDELSCATCEGGFLCSTGECFPKHYRCDLMDDCPGGEDEEGCDECQGRFFCMTGSCIDQSAVCNNITDCPGGEDESNCDRCKGFQCGTGGCIPSYFRCDTFEGCPNGEDEKDCEYCTNGFLCNDKQCKAISERCNGYEDCPEGEDEIDCETCKEGFLCKSGHCLTYIGRCDGKLHCPDGDDEEDCYTCENRFRCKTGECIVFAQWCNNVTDCPGGEDEEDCDRCPEGAFSCNTGECIPAGWRCNFIKECPGGEDEAGCFENFYASCPKGYFQCKDGLCVMGWYHCDGVDDCLYEENQCDECRPGAFKCSTSLCIEGHRVCDGVANCPEGEDELNCTNNDINARTCPPGYMKCEGYCYSGRAVCMYPVECDVDTDILCDSLVIADEAHQVRLRCSEYYRELVTLLGYSTDVNVTFDDEYCLALDQHEFWSPLCQAGVVCDRFGCYDMELNRYSESYASRGPKKMSLLCKGTTLYYDDVSLYSERLEGVLTTKSLKLLLKQQEKKSDLIDLQEMFRPSYDHQQEFAVSPEELVYSCTFDNQPCDHSHFHNWTSDRYGTCYTFNGFMHTGNSKPRTVVHVGPKNGLQLTLNVPVGLPLLSPERGMRVVIHSPFILPVPEEEGFNVGPGSSSVSVTRTENQRLGKPHGECNKYYDTDLPFEYSPLLCDQLCVEQELRQRCGCSIGLSPVYEALAYKPEERCEGKLPSQKLCMDRVKRDVIEQKIQCDCPQSCREMKYQSQVTSSKIDDTYFSILGQTRKKVPSLCSNDTELLRLLVYLGSMYYDVIEETPAYTWDTLLSNIGGSLGLFIGVSLVSILEVLEFLWDVCSISLRRCRKTGKLEALRKK
ncbi:uncharacterized protein [Penaeus vannamei]|uniref:uncharacterized protein isoform X3 n=1 Tax=Penaeus vannamei TaxID=6689 RepID=UPI00387FAD59